MAKKKQLNWNIVFAIAILIFLLFNFGPRGIDANDAADITRELLYRHPGLQAVEGRVFIDIQTITDEQTHWMIKAKVVCKPSLERAKICIPSQLVERGVALDYTIYVHKATGQVTIVEPSSSRIA